MLQALWAKLSRAGKENVAWLNKHCKKVYLFEDPAIQVLALTWSETLSISPEQVKETLSNLLEYGNCRPGKAHPLFAWWQSMMIP